MPGFTSSNEAQRQRVVQFLRSPKPIMPQTVNWVARVIDLARVPEADAVEYLRENKVDGILGHFDHDGPVLDFCRSAGVPVVGLSATDSELDIPRVLMDEAAIGRIAGEHFVERGFRHFAFCSAYSHYVLAGRLQGFREAVEPVSKTFHVIEARPGDEATMPRPDRFADELERLPRPLAVMALDDIGASLVIDACEMAGLLVPEQVAVVGCNDGPQCEFSVVKMSSVRPDVERQRGEGAELLQRLMDGEAAPSEPVRVPPIVLVVRQSSDIFAIENVTVARAVKKIISGWRWGPSVDDVAREVGVSRAHIGALFRRHLDCGVAEYVRNIRVEQVKHVLLETSWSIREVASHGGFKSASHFSTLFSKATGLSPRAWREKHRQEQ